MAFGNGCPETGVASCVAPPAVGPAPFAVSASPVAPAPRSAARRERRLVPKAGERFMLILPVQVQDRCFGKAACLGWGLPRRDPVICSALPSYTAWSPHEWRRERSRDASLTALSDRWSSFVWPSHREAKLAGR